jgi:hypothetical protein
MKHRPRPRGILAHAKRCLCSPLCNNLTRGRLALTAWDTKEKAARERAEALNSFEAYMSVYTLQVLLLLLPPPHLPFRYMMREKLDESAEWKAVTSEEQRQACTEAVAAAVNWFDEEVGMDTNTSQVTNDTL